VPRYGVWWGVGVGCGAVGVWVGWGRVVVVCSGTWRCCSCRQRVWQQQAAARRGPVSLAGAATAFGGASAAVPPYQAAAAANAVVWRGYAKGENGGSAR